MAPKMVTKLLADRLQGFILSLVHENQYGFIKTRSIQDCLAWSYEYIHQCHQSRREIIILKLDFEKAFDTVEHSAIIHMLSHLGLPALWIQWVRTILSSGHSAVLLNGVPGNNFKCLRGVRQGDPLSPLLFVLAAELLQILINKSSEENLLIKPIPQPSSDFPVVQYADDTLMIMQANARQLFFLKGLLHTYAESTGLRVNYSKSQMYSINVSNEKMNHLAATFGCEIGTMPFTYLGLPMGTTKTKMRDLTPMMDRVERRLSSCSTWLSYSGRLQMINSVITPITTYVMCSIKLPKGVIDNIDRARKQCLWRGNSEKKKGGNLVAWHTVQLPKNKGGLGIINLQLQNDALLLKQLSKFYNRENVPWVHLVWSKYYSNQVPHAAREMGSFWWKDILRLNHLWRGIMKCDIGEGYSVCFWSDLWMDEVLQAALPRLKSFVRDEGISISNFANATDLDTLFFLPLSAEALDELQGLQSKLEGCYLEEGTSDKWKPIWDGQFTAKKFYNYAHSGVPAHPFFQVVWKSKVTTRIKFFAWLVLIDRLNTKLMLQRRHIYVEDNVDCVMCDLLQEETVDHLLFQCPFAQECWNKIGISWNMSMQLLNRFSDARQSFTAPFFTEVALIAAWELWKLRNDKVFQRQAPGIDVWFDNFKRQCSL